MAPSSSLYSDEGSDGMSSDYEGEEVPHTPICRRNGSASPSTRTSRRTTAWTASTPPRMSTSEKDAQRYVLKKAIEKKFRDRYVSLQQAYEQRLHALAVQVQEAVYAIENDSAMHTLKENAFTSEYAHVRLGEIVQECFHGEREKYIKALSDQVAWQASDLREIQQKLRLVEKREQDTQQQWKHAQREIQALHHQLDVRVQELHDEKRHAVRQEEAYRSLCEEKDALSLELEKMKQSMQSFELLRHEYETLKVKMQNESEQERVTQGGFKKAVQELQATKNKLEMDKRACEQESAHLKQLLAISETKCKELTQTLQQLQSEDYPTKIARLEAELNYQRQAVVTLEREHEEVKKKYEEFGAQVELYMSEQSEQKAAVLKKSEEQIKQLQAHLNAVRQEGQDALKTKQMEMMRAMDQLKFRQEALAKLEQKNVMLEERITALDAQKAEEKLQSAKQVSQLEKEIAQWRHSLEKEQEKNQHLHKVFLESKEKYEHKIAALQSTLDHQNQQSVKEKELEARTRRQNDLITKYEARIEALKVKYDAALEKQQAELLHARQLAMDTANNVASKLERSKEEDQQERRHRLEMAVREKERRDEEKTRELAFQRMQHELQEREKQLAAREKTLLEKERKEERRQSDALRKDIAAPNVVVLNVSSSDDELEQARKENGKVVAVVNRRGNRNSEKDRNNDEYIPVTQHIAELQAREAQVALQSEERLQKSIQEFQDKKEKEFRAAMANVRKGIQKLELTLEETRAEKKRIEEQLLSERQAFVSLKHEFEEMQDAKRVVIQRLTEANDNIGKLRTVVKNTQAKCEGLEKEVANAHQQKDSSIAIANESHQTIQELRNELETFTAAKCQLENSLASSNASREELQTRLDELRKQLQHQEQEMTNQKNAFDEQKIQELLSTSSQYDIKVLEMAAKIEEMHLQLQAGKKNTEALESSLQQITTEKDTLRAKVEQLKGDSVRQQKEFADLARMHKNLTETMNVKVSEERNKRIAAEQHVGDMAEQLKQVKVEKLQALHACQIRLRQLAREWSETRNGIRKEMEATWTHFHREMIRTGTDWRKRSEQMLIDEAKSWKRALKHEREEWKRKLDQKDKEMDALVTNQRVNDQTKYDRVVQRLEKKSRALESLESRLKAQIEMNTGLQRTLQQLESDRELRLMEQSQLHDRFSTSQMISERDAEEKHQTQLLLERLRATCQIFRDFAITLAQDHGFVPPGIIVRDISSNRIEAWEEQQLSVELKHLSEIFNEKKEIAIAKAKEDAIAPIAAELKTVKNALIPFSKRLEEESDDVYQHLPWYVGVTRAIKQQHDDFKKGLAALQAELSLKETQLRQLDQSKVETQELNNVLRFEKETVLREMELLTQNLQKKKEHELHDLRIAYERQIEQLKHQHGKEQLQINQEHQVALDQLRDLLEAERRNTSSSKTDVIMNKMELERVQEEMKDKQAKLEKEIDELRETAMKWKRKAKLGVNSPATTPSKGNFLLSSSFHGTEDDSDASYRLLLPPARRKPSSAMADLSSLLEQSLQDIRKESVIPHPSPLRRQHPSPSRIFRTPSPSNHSIKR